MFKIKWMIIKMLWMPLEAPSASIFGLAQDFGLTSYDHTLSYPFDPERYSFKIPGTYPAQKFLQTLGHSMYGHD